MEQERSLLRPTCFMSQQISSTKADEKLRTKGMPPTNIFINTDPKFLNTTLVNYN